MGGVSSELLKKYGFSEEERLEGAKFYTKTGYPKPIKNYKIILESSDTPIEQWYYWVLDYLRYDYAMLDIEKITDVFTASENSAFFGVSQQRLGIQQDKVSQFLATIGKMVKELFQLVRELRIIDERLRFYNDSMSDSKSAESAEIALKGMWIDMVEQGSKNPASVYGLARELGFGTLPDLFFSTHPKTPEEVDEVVDKLDFNRKVREVLKRKLRTYLEWKKSTYEELKTRRKFTLKYLRQHFDIIRMYMTWVKPYLRYIKRLSMNQQQLQSPDLVNAFETSMIEVELLFKYKKKPSDKFYSCVLVSFDYRTRPAMSYTQEGYNRGPLHTGRLEMNIRGYAWTDDQIKKFKEMKQEEELDLIGVVDGSVKAAMEALGDELKKYLKQAGEEFPEDEEQQPQSTPSPSALEPFINIFKGFGELFSAFFPKKEKKDDGVVITANDIDLKLPGAKSYAKKACWDCYKNFKKSHGLLAW